MMNEGDYIEVMTTAHVVETVALAIHERILSAVGQSMKVQV
jgi:hypothetical protein